MEGPCGSPPIVNMLMGGQRSNNATPHHYYSTPSAEQPSSFISTHSYGSGEPLHHIHNTRRPSVHANAAAGLVHQLHHPPNPRPQRSRGQSPAVNSLGGTESLMMDTSSIAPAPPPHHVHHHPGGHHLNNPSPHIHLTNIGHGHNHLHDDSHIHINCGDTSSHSISPPNSNSNTTISCGSGNSTSANIGAPTSRTAVIRGTGVGGEAMPPSSRSHHNNNNSHRSHTKDSSGISEDYENYRNNRRSSSRNRSTGGKGQLPKQKKSILEDDCEKSGGCGNSSMDEDNDHCISGCNKRSFKQRPPFINPNQEFLPICDALFNMISLAAYFCDVVFDVLTVYTWYKMSIETEEDLYELSYSAVLQQQRKNGRLSSGEIEERVSSMPREFMWQWSLLGVVFIALSCFLSQLLSFKWYKESERRGQKAPDGTFLDGPPAPCSSSVLVAMHVSLVGVLWRYFKLFIPVDLRFVKNEVRDLCLLRLIHAFCQAAPMLLLQLYLIWHEPGFDTVTDLTKVSTCLSLFSVCWSLASFSKHIRHQNVHKLVLTWLGVIFQFFWRFGTVTSRFLALSLYAIVYQYWVFVVLFLHWFCMLLWLISPKNIFHGEKMSRVKKLSYSAIVAVVYTICYINVQETNSRVKVVIYYVTMFMENCLLLSVWLIAVRYEDEIWFRSGVTYAVVLCFFGGLCFMGLYYRYFHVKKLSYVYDAESSIYRNTSSIGGCSLMNDNGSMLATISGGVDYDGRGKGNGVIMGYNSRSGTTSGSNAGQGSKKKIEKSSNREGQVNENKKSEDAPKTEQMNKMNGHTTHHPTVAPGVFNCRFHPAMKRKKKKPTTFVPPPAVQQNNENSGGQQPLSATALAAQMMMLSAPKNSSQVAETSSSSLLPRHVPMDREENSVLLCSTPLQQKQQHSMLDESHLGHHQNHSHHHRHSHLDNHYDVSNTTNCGGSSSPRMSPHYDLPEDFDPNSSAGVGMQSTGMGGGGGSNASSYGPIYPGMYPTIKGGRMMVPFWRRPMSITMGSENEGSVSSRIDIQQKLQEKRQQQLAELKEIEEEIKQGKLKRPELHEMMPEIPVNGRQPIPVEKKQPWFAAGGDDIHPPGIIDGEHSGMMDPQQYLMYASASVCGPGNHGMASPTYQMMDNGSAFYYSPEWPPVTTIPNFYEPLYQNGDDCLDQDDDEDDSVSAAGGMRGEGDGQGDVSPPSGSGGAMSGGDNGKGGRLCDRRRRGRGVGADPRSKACFDPSSRESIYKSYRIPSDIDSQMSLPRSYTLPREFKYKRKFRKPVKTENFLPSTNSSDGDVDSGEEAEIYNQIRGYPLPLPSMHHVHHMDSIPGSSGPSPATVGASAVISPMTSSSAITPTASSTNRQSRKNLNNRPRHKLHETKL